MLIPLAEAASYSSHIQHNGSNFVPFSPMLENETSAKKPKPSTPNEEQTLKQHNELWTSLKDDYNKDSLLDRIAGIPLTLFKIISDKHNNLLHHAISIAKDSSENRNKKGMTPVIKLIERSCALPSEEKETLINQQNCYGETPLHLACKSCEGSSHKYVELLLQNGARLDLHDIKGKTALHSLCSSHNPTNKSVEKKINLLAEYSADLNQPDQNGILPLQHLLRVPKIKIIYLFVEKYKAKIPDTFLKEISQLQKQNKRKNKIYTDVFYQNMKVRYEKQREEATSSVQPGSVSTSGMKRSLEHDQNSIEEPNNKLPRFLSTMDEAQVERNFINFINQLNAPPMQPKCLEATHKGQEDV